MVKKMPPIGKGQGPGDAVRGPEHQGGCQEDGEGQVLDTRPQGEEGEERLSRGLAKGGTTLQAWGRSGRSSGW